MISKYLGHFCRDDLSKIENYDKAMADSAQTWDCHHRLETHRYTDRTRTSWERREEDVSVEMSKAAIVIAKYNCIKKSNDGRVRRGAPGLS